MTLVGSTISQFFAGAVQLLGAVFGILAAYFFFMWQRTESVYLQTTASLDQALEDFISAVAIITNSDAAREIPVHILRDEEQFDILLSSVTEDVNAEKSIYIRQLAEAPRRYRRQLAALQYYRVGSIPLWIGILSSAIGSIVSIFGLLFVENDYVYSLNDITCLTNIRRLTATVMLCIVILSSIISILSIIIAIVSQNRRSVT